MSSYVSTLSPSGDSSSEENQPLEQRERVSFSIQINIEEIFKVQVQAKDVPEDILVTDLPANEVCQEADEGVSLSPIRRSQDAITNFFHFRGHFSLEENESLYPFRF